MYVNLNAVNTDCRYCRKLLNLKNMCSVILNEGDHLKDGQAIDILLESICPNCKELNLKKLCLVRKKSVIFVKENFKWK